MLINVHIYINHCARVCALYDVYNFSALLHYALFWNINVAASLREWNLELNLILSANCVLPKYLRKYKVFLFRISLFMFNSLLRSYYSNTVVVKRIIKDFHHWIPRLCNIDPAQYIILLNNTMKNKYETTDFLTNENDTLPLLNTEFFK